MSLLFDLGQSAIQGEDSMGSYEGKSFTYMAGSVSINYQVMVYEGGRFARFRQVNRNTDGSTECLRHV